VRLLLGALRKAAPLVVRRGARQRGWGLLQAVQQEAQDESVWGQPARERPVLPQEQGRAALGPRVSERRVPQPER